MLALRAGPGAPVFSVGIAVLHALCVYSTERREGLTHSTSLGISCLPGWRLCHRPLKVGM